jgi:hypothetical protein
LSERNDGGALATLVDVAVVVVLVATPAEVSNLTRFSVVELPQAIRPTHNNTNVRNESDDLIPSGSPFLLTDLTTT